MFLFFIKQKSLNVLLVILVEEESEKDTMQNKSICQLSVFSMKVKHITRAIYMGVWSCKESYSSKTVINVKIRCKKNGSDDAKSSFGEYLIMHRINIQS